MAPMARYFLVKNLRILSVNQQDIYFHPNFLDFMNASRTSPLLRSIPILFIQSTFYPYLQGQLLQFSSFFSITACSAFSIGQLCYFYWIIMFWLDDWAIIEALWLTSILSIEVELIIFEWNSLSASNFQHKVDNLSIFIVSSFKRLANKSNWH